MKCPDCNTEMALMQDRYTEGKIPIGQPFWKCPKCRNEVYYLLKLLDDDSLLELRDAINYYLWKK